MAFNRTRVRAALAVTGLAATAFLAACGEDDVDILRPNLESDIFETYVALGNSITAGFQSGGIVDSTQRESYVRYLFEIMGNDSAQYRYPSIAYPGCPAPQANFVTGALLGNTPNTNPPICALRANSLNRLNNYGVPGATVLDPTATTTPFSSALTSLILGGRSQVSRALEADPTFVTAWIGNNDILAAAVTGLTVPSQIDLGGGTVVRSPGITPVATFTAAYGRMVDSLLLAPRLRGGALVGVVDVTNIPVLFSGALLLNPQIKGAIDAAAGRTVTVLPNCTADTQTLISLRILPLLRANATLPISCEKLPGQAVAGDLFILDGGERTAIADAVAAYNANISQRATAADFAYLDPNPLLAAARTRGDIPVFPTLNSPTAPFGALISLDGVHPARPAHKLVANALAKAIGAKYSIQLDTIPVN